MTKVRGGWAFLRVEDFWKNGFCRDQRVRLLPGLSPKEHRHLHCSAFWDM